MGFVKAFVKKDIPLVVVSKHGQGVLSSSDVGGSCGLAVLQAHEDVL